MVRKLLEGYKRLKASKDIREPITIAMLRAIVENLHFVCSNSYEVALFKAAILLGYFGMLRVSEYTASSKTVWDRAIQFTNTQVGKDFSVSVLIDRSKTDQSGKGMGLIIEPCSCVTICPGLAMSQYITNFRPAVEGPLFVHVDGTPLTSFQFSSVFRKAVSAAGLSVHGKTTHSLRIGACSMASVRGIPDHEIKQYGRWTSRAYKSYIRIPTNKIAHC